MVMQRLGGVATFLAISGGQWLTYVPEGYFTGSKEAERLLMMKVEEAGKLYPIEILALQNPNPQKISEALRRAGHLYSVEKTKSKIVLPPRPLSGKAPLKLSQG